MNQAHHNLPTFPTPFIGRADEIAELSQLLDNPDCRLLTLVGPGGIGKTRLSIEVGRCKLDAFPDGAYFVPLQPLQAADQVVPAVIDALPLQVTGDPEPQLLDYLRARQLLLLLDNFEHVLAGADLVRRILADAPNVTMLATSREILNLRGEWVRAVTGLAYPDNGSTQDGNDYSAVDLFAESAHRLSGNFSLDNEYEHVVRICQLVEGIPLALELAAGWTNALSCADIAEEIQRNLDFLTSATRDLPARHRSMQTVFDHSWRLLTEDEQIVMRRFAVFRGGCTREAAEQITGATLRTLASLVAKSMLRHDPVRGRYDVQELSRQYAHAQLVDAGSSDAAQEAHCHHYAGFMQQRAADVKGRRQLEALDEIEADWNNVRVAWRWALAHRDWERVGQMMETLHLFCDMRAHYFDGDTLFQAAVDALGPCEGEKPHPLWGELLVRTAALLELPVPDQWSERAVALLDLAEQQANVGDDPLYLWARADLTRPISAEAFSSLEASLVGFRACGDRYYMARALRLLAWTSVRQGDLVEFFAPYKQQYLDLTREIGDETGKAHALFYEGRVAFFSHRLAEAEPLFHEAGATWHKLGDRKSMAIISCYLGDIAFQRGDFVRARPLLEEAAKLSSDTNYLWPRHRALQLLGAMACFEGDYGTSQHIAAESPASELPRFGFLVAAVSLGDFLSAREHLQVRLRWYQMHPVVPWIVSHPPFDDYPIKVFPMAAMLLAHEGEPEWAVELLARQASEREIPMGYFEHWALLDKTRADLEQQLGAADFDAAWKRGETLDVETTTRQLLAYLGDESVTSQAQANQTLIEPLTERELEVLSLLAQGRSNRQIAETLVIAVGTVKRYVYTICQKLDADNRTHAVARARELGLL